MADGLCIHPINPFGTDLKPLCDCVTITMSRAAAERVAGCPEDERFPVSSELGRAARAALEGER